MATLLLIIIYISFISLGLPDSLLGSAWPVLHKDLNVPISAAGIATMITAGGTIISSFQSNRLIKKFGTGKVTAVSVCMTAFALLGTYLTGSFGFICLMAVPMGLGAGAVDAALNNFVALHYKASHMSWLHCFWGVGATAGPLIMAFFLGQNGAWRNGYLTIGIIQVCLVIALFASLPFWKHFEAEPTGEEVEKTSNKLGELLKIKGAKAALLSFFCYCAAELTAGLWGSSYLVEYKGLEASVAARWVSMYYFGITFGRFISGFLTMKFNNKQLIRLGELLCLVGAITLLLPFNSAQLIGLLVIGIGCAPIYPSMLHETPRRFGKELSQAVMGIQMACAYIGSTFMPPLFGLLAGHTGMFLFPFFLIALIILMLISSEMINRVIKTRENQNFG